MINNIGLQMVKLSIRKNEDLDLIKATGNSEQFEYIPEDAFDNAKNILIIGASNIRNINKIIECCPIGSSIKILENDISLIKKLELDKTNHSEKCVETLNCDWKNLKLDYQNLKNYISKNATLTLDDYRKIQENISKQCENKPLINSGWADVVYIDSLNRFNADLSKNIIAQVFELMSRYGKILINVVLSDEKTTKNIQHIFENTEVHNIPKEDEVIEILIKEGLHGVNYKWRSELPVKVVDKVELRPFLLEAYKGKQGICKEKGHAVFYNGPWKEVIDDDGHKLVRGQRMAVCEKSYKVLTSAPYNKQVIGIDPYYILSEEEAPLFDCSVRPVRHPKITKGINKVNEEINDINENSKCC